MADPTELTHEQLSWMLREYASGATIDEQRALTDMGLATPNELFLPPRTLTPRGRELVDIALRAVNAELRSKGGERG